MKITKQGLILGTTALAVSGIAITGFGLRFSQTQAFFQDNPKELVDEVWQVINRRYVDATFNGEDRREVRNDYLEKEYNKETTAIELLDVVRQEKESGILSYATSIRNKIENDFYDDISFNFDPFNDIVHVEDGEHLMNLIQDSYTKYGLEETALIVRSNKRANLYNQALRDKILNNDNTINVGDLLMVSR